ncbi:hypothetical protein MRX96_002227 [Rhipicephalus microplus]
MEHPAECRNLSRGEQQVFWTHVWQSELRVAVEETATNICVSRELAQDMFDRLVCRTLHARRAATATLSEESVRGSAASRSKAQQESPSTPTNSC